MLQHASEGSNEISPVVRMQICSRAVQVNQLRGIPVCAPAAVAVGNGALCYRSSACMLAPASSCCVTHGRHGSYADCQAAVIWMEHAVAKHNVGSNCVVQSR
jgi:hypothetical protein